MQISIKTAQAHHNTCCVVIRSSSLSQQSLVSLTRHRHTYVLCLWTWWWWGGGVVGSSTHIQTQSHPAYAWSWKRRLTSQAVPWWWHTANGAGWCHRGTDRAWGHLRWPRLGGRAGGRFWASGELGLLSAISKEGPISIRLLHGWETWVGGHL